MLQSWTNQQSDEMPKSKWNDVRRAKSLNDELRVQRQLDETKTKRALQVGFEKQTLQKSSLKFEKIL